MRILIALLLLLPISHIALGQRPFNHATTSQGDISGEQNPAASNNSQPLTLRSEEAVADHIPWSGYWWPISKGELIQPLQKYDSYSRKRAAVWELEVHPPGKTAEPWHGYCHGWAAAAVLEKEPTQFRASSQVQFTVADQKALFSACHAFDPGVQHGDRFGDGNDDDALDMAPELVCQVLQAYVRDRKQPVVFDLDAGPEVWNYPVFAYRIDVAPLPLSHGRDRHAAVLKLWAADDAVPPEFVGTHPHVQIYTFQFTRREGRVVAGSAQWTGQSVKNHPDFAWYPERAQPENPELDYELVRKLIAGEIVDSADHSRAQLAGSNQPATIDVRQLLKLAHAETRPADVPVVLSPVELVGAIANRTSDFGLDAQTAKLGRIKYQIGDRLALKVTSQRAGYLYVMHVNSEGEMQLLFPAVGQENKIAADTRFIVPQDERLAYFVTGPSGQHRLKVIVTSQPLILTGLDRRVVAAEPEGDAATGTDFRLFPTQQKQIQDLLKEYVRGGTVTEEQLGVAGIHKVLPEFSQDEIVYYVQPNQ